MEHLCFQEASIVAISWLRKNEGQTAGFWSMLMLTHLTEKGLEIYCRSQADGSLGPPSGYVANETYCTQYST
jgi:hypothetical protein